jgi:TET-associated glycosyltransferase-like protein
MVPIFIPSKGKAIPGQTPTTDLLKGVREYVMFVEPEEVSAYEKLHERVVSIEKSNLKIGYARWYIQQYAYRNGVEASWILDDDIKALYRVPDHKGEPSVNGGAAVSFRDCGDAEVDPVRGVVCLPEQVKLLLTSGSLSVDAGIKRLPR